MLNRLVLYYIRLFLEVMAEESWDTPNSMLAIIYLLWVQIVH